MTNRHTKTTKVWIADFGSQYTQLITRRVRELGYSSEIMTPHELKERFAERPKVLILSGGPQSIFDDEEDYNFLFQTEKAKESEELAILGICYGLQLMSHTLGGKVVRGTQGEYGAQKVQVKAEGELDPHSWLKNHLHGSTVWMSHSDHVEKLPPEFSLLMESHDGLVAGIKHHLRPWWGVQFHPEVEHTTKGRDFLQYFLEEVAKLGKKDWTEDQIYREARQLVEKEVGEQDYVLCAFSGGVDSLVAATLTEKVIKDRLYCFFVDTGLLRPQDYTHIELLKKETNLQIEILDCREEFWQKLEGVEDPEEKRKIIGHTFIEVFERKVHQFEQDHQIHFRYLLQGTLYPDVIESVTPHSSGGKSVTIKSHHNVGGLPERMHLKLLEPLRFLFKDEVRALGLHHLELPRSWVFRHPFPGPGLGVRILGPLSKKNIAQVQQSDQILLEELNNFSCYDQVWQAFTVFLPVKTVGVKGDARAYEEVLCVRLVNSTDGMTAEWSQVPYEFLNKVSRRITNEVPGITRVVYDITSKPPGTIEWE